MSIRVRRKNAKPRRADDKDARNQRDEGWEVRLRLVGNARFVEVEWSKRDNPLLAATDLVRPVMRNVLWDDVESRLRSPNLTL